MNGDNNWSLNHNPETTDATLFMEQLLELQRSAQLQEGGPSYETRIDRIDRVLMQLIKYQDQLAEAINSDFGCRSILQNKMSDIAAGVLPLKNARKHLKKWMRTEKRRSMFPLDLLGASSQVQYQPLGVVGIISPWNFPVNLAFSPLADVLAAGNRAMIKPSELTPATSEVTRVLIEEVFDSSEIAVVTGGPEVGRAFSSLPFDHLIFTGATSVAKHIMAACSKSLVPLTLELGGKSPVILSDSADIEKACARIAYGKTWNAGQVCLAPDYVLLEEGKLDEFVEYFTKSVSAMFPTVLNNPDYTSIINERHYRRLHACLSDAEKKGASLITINPANDSFVDQPFYKLPPTLVINPSEDMLVMQEEIFGPILPIKTYHTLDDAIEYINQKPRPLALYYFGKNPEEEARILARTTSGGVTINDVIMHVAQEDLPFGGIGPSGMGHYHGYDGFKNFSHAKSVFRQSKIDISGITGMRPPYGPKLARTLKMLLRH